ncbi:MAG TPA: hypothetical protein VFJ16_03750 [Longimicrobium sp.]|nr:hypothetical protein [Longimicrobium sp.]
MGVLVGDEHGIAVRFVGETPDGLDLRTAHRVRQDGAMYAEWHAFWRRQVALYNDRASREPGDPNAFFESLIEHGGDVFSIYEGGEFIPDEGQRLPEIADELFNRVVRTDVETKADNRDGGVGRTPSQLFKEVRGAFRKLGILSTENYVGGTVPPSDGFIRARYPVKGTEALFRPNFVQRNGNLAVMENVDYSLTDADRATEHALYTASMLADVRSANEAVVPIDLIVIVHSVAGMNENAQKAGRAAIERVGGVRQVLWNNSEDKERFLHERERAARH